MYLSAESIISFAALLAAIIAVAGYYNRAYRWVSRQEAQDKDIADIKDEQGILTNGVLACLKGLKEQGCDGPVTDAIAEIEEHLNRRAHK